MEFRFSLLLVVCSTLFLSSCVSSKNMQYQGFTNFKVNNVANEPTVNVDIKLYNPNFFGGKLKAMEFNVLVDDKIIGSAGIPDPIRIKRKSEFILPVECTTSLDKMGGLLALGLQSYFSSSEVPVGIEGTMTVQKFIFFRRTFAFKYDDKIDIKKIMGN